MSWYIWPCCLLGIRESNCIDAVYIVCMNRRYPIPSLLDNPSYLHTSGHAVIPVLLIFAGPASRQSTTPATRSIINDSFPPAFKCLLKTSVTQVSIILKLVVARTLNAQVLQSVQVLCPGRGPRRIKSLCTPSVQNLHAGSYPRVW